MSNQITGPNAGWPRQFSIRASLAARVGRVRLFDFMRTKLIVSAVCILTFVGGSLAGFYYGLKVGAQNATWRADIETTGVLLHAFKLQETGESKRSAAVLHTLLYLSALNTDKYKDNLLLTDNNRKAGERCLQRVADYYWSHPTSFALEWEGTNSLPSGALGHAVPPVIKTYDGRHKRIADILLARKKVGSNGPANGSQPIRSDTNSTSPAAGARR